MAALYVPLVPLGCQFLLTSWVLSLFCTGSCHGVHKQDKWHLVLVRWNSSKAGQIYNPPAGMWLQMAISTPLPSSWASTLNSCSVFLTAIFYLLLWVISFYLLASLPSEMYLLPSFPFRRRHSLLKSSLLLEHGSIIIFIQQETINHQHQIFGLDATAYLLSPLWWLAISLN